MDGVLPLVTAIAPVLRGRVLFAVPTRSPRFVLTVDDGPDPTTTPALLGALRRRGAHATFFLIGERASAHPELVARIVAEGHEVGNHTWRDEPTWRLPLVDFRDGLRATQRVLEAHGPVRWFRPGSGWPTPGHLTIAEEEGLRCVLGTAVAVSGAGAGTARTARRLGRVVRRGSIVVLHEGPHRAGITVTVDELVERTARRGLSAVTLSEAACPTSEDRGAGSA
jgi:peptidoglycan-N-acetylglucosamine deacetylase